MGSHRIMEGEHEFFLLCGQPMTSPIRGDLHLMAGRLILRFNFSKPFFVTNSFFNDSRVWLGSGDNGKWTIAHLTPILKMKPYFWLCLAHEIFYTDDVTFHRCPINTCFVVWRTLWFMSYLLHSSFTSQNCIFFICSFTKKKFHKLYLHTIRHYFMGNIFS